MSDIVITETTETTETAAPKGASDMIIPEHGFSKAQKILRSLGWVGFFVLCILIFTIIKIPEIRLKNYIQGSLSSLLSKRGITLSAAKTKVSFLFGISYTMEEVTINLPPPDAPVKVDRIQVSPSLIPLILGKASGSAEIEQGSGFIKLSFSASDFQELASGRPGAKSEVAASFRAKDFNLGKIALLQILAGVRGGLTAAGEGSFSGELGVPSSWSGDVRIDLTKVAIEQQPLYGFNIPAIKMADGKIELSVAGGKATIKTLRLGKAGSTDDLSATVTGDLQLGRTWDASTMNLKTKFALSQTALKSLSLLDMLLAAGKQSDGSFAYNLSGSVGAPTATPVKQ